MVQDILRTPSPSLQQSDILRKFNLLNYVLAQWNDEYERIKEQKQTTKGDIIYT
jgi:hypothetical protein